MANSDQRYGSIYALIDPHSKKIRYIGQTTRPLQERLREHIKRNESPALRTWIVKLGDEGKQPIMRALVEQCPVDLLDVEERKQIDLHRKQGRRLLNVQHNPDRLSEAIFWEIFHPLGKRRINEEERIEPLSFRMQRVVWGHLKLEVVSVFAAIGLIVAGTVLDRALPALGGAVVVIGGGVAMFPPPRHINQNREDRLNLFVTWPIMLIGQGLVISAILVGAPDSWYLVASGFILLAIAARLFLSRQQMLEAERESSAYIDVAEVLECPSFDFRAGILLLGAFATWFGGTGISGLAGAEGSAGFSRFEQIMMAMIGIVMLIGAVERLRKIPMSRKTRYTSIFTMIMSGLGWWFALMLAEIVAEQGGLSGWLVVLMFLVMATGLHFGAIDDIARSGTEIARHHQQDVTSAAVVLDEPGS